MTLIINGEIKEFNDSFSLKDIITDLQKILYQTLTVLQQYLILIKKKKTLTIK